MLNMSDLHRNRGASHVMFAHHSCAGAGVCYGYDGRTGGADEKATRSGSVAMQRQPMLRKQTGAVDSIRDSVLDGEVSGIDDSEKKNIAVNRH